MQGSSSGLILLTCTVVCQLTVVFVRWTDLSCTMGLDRKPSFFCVAIPHDASPQLHVWHEATLDGTGWKKKR